MKIFGGGGSRHKKSANAKPTAKKASSSQRSVRPNGQTEQIVYARKATKGSPKGAVMAKKSQKPKSIVTKILCVIAAILALTIAAGAIWVAINVKKPQISVNNNDNISNSATDEDAPAVDLNVGDRIDDFFTFMVCATDIDETRTDNIMVVAFDTKKHTVNVMNVPRDIMSNVNKTGANKKINAAYARGIEQTKKQVAQVMGFIPDKYMVVNFNGIADIVNAIGGVDYEIPFPMMYSDPTQDLEIHFPKAGMQHLNGEQVVEFLRWRKNGPGYRDVVPSEYLNGDETRIAKQQEFLMYLAKQVLTPANAFNFKNIADAVFKNVKTDITAGEMLWLAGQAFQVDTSTGIQMFTLPGYSAMSTAGTDTALSFYFVNESKALELINTYFNPYDKPIQYLDLVSGPTKPSADYTHDEDEEERNTPQKDDDDDDDGSTQSSQSSTNNGETNTSDNTSSGSDSQVSQGSGQGNTSDSSSDNTSGSNNSGNSGSTDTGSSDSQNSGSSDTTGNSDSGNTGSSNNTTAPVDPEA